jgi:tRNA pseudouridine55 synthase
MMDGLLVLDKPVGPTSHDVVARVRRLLAEPRVGHTGTLDPGASGVLPLVIGRATRLARFLSGADKSYEATIQLGTATDSWDSDGRPTGLACAGPFPDRKTIEHALDRFRGTFLQQPPAYSAKRIAGTRSHRLARAAASDATSVPILPAPVEVTVSALKLLEVDGARVTIRVDCSAGFYVRGLAHDLGEQLGTGAHLAGLRRVRSGEVTIADATPLAILERDADAARAAIVPLRQILPGLPGLRLTREGVRRAGHGLDVGLAHVEAGLDAGAFPAGARALRLLDQDGDLIAVGEPVEESGLLHPAVVLV